MMNNQQQRYSFLFSVMGKIALPLDTQNTKGIQLQGGFAP